MWPSIGRKGSCYDNAVAEAFFTTLKAELPTATCTTRNQARSDIFAYLYYYNHDRLHSTKGHRTPSKHAPLTPRANHVSANGGQPTSK